MNRLTVGIMSIPTIGRLTLSLPRGVPLDCANSSSIVLISEKMRRQLSRNSFPSWVKVTVRVLRWNKRTPSRSSRRATALPMADDERPSWRPASVKLRASAARTKTLRAPRLSKFACPIDDTGVLVVRSVWNIVHCCLVSIHAVERGARAPGEFSSVARRGAPPRLAGRRCRGDSLDNGREMRKIGGRGTYRQVPDDQRQ